MLPNTPSFPPIGQPFIVLPTVDSTNNYAMAQARDGLATHGSVYFAMEQTSGKGQRGKKWITKPGENIILSVVLQPGVLSINHQFLLSASMSLACYDFFKKYAGDDKTRIKWPNDLYWQDRKAGGILIESVVRSQASGVGSQESGVLNQERSENIQITHPTPDYRLQTSPWQWAIVGIGININQSTFNQDLPNPVSLKQITGKNHDVIELARELCKCMENRYVALQTKTAVAISEEYTAALYKINQPVKLKKGSAVFETTLQGVSLEGKLLTKDVLERAFDFGEVEWVG